jgi:serine/threonine protein kinase
LTDSLLILDDQLPSWCPEAFEESALQSSEVSVVEYDPADEVEAALDQFINDLLRQDDPTAALYDEYMADMMEAPSDDEDWEDSDCDWDQEYLWFIEEEEAKDAAARAALAAKRLGAAMPGPRPKKPSRFGLRLNLPSRKGLSTRTDLAVPETFDNGLTITTKGVHDADAQPMGRQLSLKAFEHPKHWTSLSPEHGVYTAREVSVLEGVRRFLGLCFRGVVPVTNADGLLSMICGNDGFLAHRKVLKLMAMEHDERAHLRDNVSRELRHLRWCQHHSAQLPPEVLVTEGAFLVDDKKAISNRLRKDHRSAGTPIPKTVAFVFPHLKGAQDLRHWFPKNQPAVCMPEPVKSVAEALIRLVTLKVVLALAALHADHVVHHDLKLDQVMVSERQVWLIDYGSSVVRAQPASQCQTVCHSKVTSPMHNLVKEDWDGSGALQCCTKYDIWSLGVALVELVTGETVVRNQWVSGSHGFESHRRTAGELHDMIRQSSTAPAFQEFVILCTQHDTNRRPTADALLRTPYLEEYNGLTSAELDDKQQQLMAEFQAFS